MRLGPLDAGQVADLRSYLDAVPDPRSRRGRWYSLTAILLVCACAAVSGARSIEELAEWGQRASNALLVVIGIRRHLLGWRRTPSPATIGRVLGTVDGDALDRAVGAYLADRHRVATEPAHRPSPSASGRPCVIAVDGKTLKGSARLTAKRRHLLSAVTHAPVVTLAQVEVGAKTNETTHFQPLLAPLDLAGTVVTFDALHSVKANVSWLVETKKAHYIAVIKTNQPTAHSQLADLPWRDIPVQHTASTTGHGRRESRSIKTCAVPDELGGISFPTAAWPSVSTAAASKPASARPGRASTPSPASTPTRPAPPALPPRSAGTGGSRTPHTTSGTSPSPKTPPPSTPAPHPAPWQPSATSPSAS
ncbi:ISAs1 family transposase [Streptomyces sp. NBC_01571]|uniref:ISAs1 family transposase n=1 Tax=Streptomyces sp. NBC_01571 TaxID=2975883 RepID=UPI00225930B1|nr:ISAs1 family transposase [Streptomyces sp. NBC_01571]MCX4571910.1 ISAs1 family transposase [Streptomyces sp. NBC_01571]MCX4581357.1 ISAs1 family transposase [Streptomyces sp. NBC_01571]MCX4581368.1 ISAs1 family transposase [Streptomyces sp. NBC_01571]